MQTIKASGHTEAHPRLSPRVLRQLKSLSPEVASASSLNKVNQVRKDIIPTIVDRRSPRSSVPERKRPTRKSVLEVEISKLQEELKQSRNRLSTCESREQQTQQEAENSKEQIYALTQKLELSQKKLLDLSASEKTCLTNLQKISQELHQVLKSKPEDIHNQSAALVFVIDRIQGLKVQLEVIVASENAKIKQAELRHLELQSLKGSLAEVVALVHKMKNPSKDVKGQDAMVQEIANKTLLQLESARHNIEALRLDGGKGIESYKAIASELDQSRAHVNVLEELVSKLQNDLNNSSNKPQKVSDDTKDSRDFKVNNTTEEPNQLKIELCTLKSEVERLRSALKEAEMKNHDIQLQSAIQIRIARELVEQIKSESSEREAKLEAMLEKTNAGFDELKANLMDKDTELQRISVENDDLKFKLEKSSFHLKYSELQKEVEERNDNVADINTKLMVKETELQNILEENEFLKSEIRRREMDNGKVVAEAEATRAAEQEALIKLDIVMEEADKSNRRAARITEHLEAAQTANSEMESELRRLKVQSDQWRKAAETAIAMLSAGDNGMFVEKTGAVDNNFNFGPGKYSTHYFVDMDDDFIKNKNGNKLKKFGMLWKKTQK